jgi:hypothetical protein
MSKKVDYFVKFDIVGSTPQYDLFELDARLVPFMLRAIEGVKGRSFWIDEANYQEAYYRLSELQARLLMPFGERYINEVRALRDGPNTPLEARDPELDPYTLLLSSVRDVRFNLQTGGFSAAELLDQIRLQLIAANERGVEDSEVIAQIAAIIVGVPPL